MELVTTTPESVNITEFDISALRPGVKFGYFNFTFTIAGACPIDVDVVMEVVFQIIEN